MSIIKSESRNQTSAFPVTLEEMIDENNPVRVIDLFVDGLDIAKLQFVIKGKSNEGRPGYDVKALMKLYVYGYLNRIRTSRLLERECIRNVELMWLLGNVQPCFRTISGFRSDNKTALNNLFKLFVQMMRSWNLLGCETAAIDSSKFRAVNSKKNNFNPKKIERHLAYIDNRIAEYLADMEKADAADDNEKADCLNANIITQLQRKTKYKDIAKQLEETGATQISTTDADARSMIIHGQVVEVCYNVQTVVDDKFKLIAHYGVTNENDRKALAPMALAAKEVLGVSTLNALADKGYDNDEQLYTCQGNNIVTYVAQKEIPRKNLIPTEDYYGEKFVYKADTDTYICPQGHIMKTPGTWYEKKYKNNSTPVKHYKTSKCRTCPARSQCTTNSAGRIIERSKYAKVAQANNKRITEQYHVYRKRQEIVEHVFGTIKRQWSYDHILLKGLEKNAGEFGLIYFTYNLRRVINILGIKELKRRLKSLFFKILCQYNCQRLVETIFSTDCKPLNTLNTN